MKLTTTTFRTLTLPEGKADHIHFDDAMPGFGVRLRRSGARSWVVQYAIAGKTRRMALGSTAVLDLEPARKRAKEILSRVALGEDPARARTEERARAGETFGQCIGLYLQRRRIDPRLRFKSYSEIERHLDRNLKALHPLHITAVTRRAIAIELTRITERGAVEANRTRASLIKAMDWCAREGFIESNPAALTNKNAEQSRSRVLVMKELADIWNALPEGDFGDIIKLLMLTGCRLREISYLRWDEINPERDTIVIPAARSKNRLAHTIHLVPAAAAILRAREQTEARGAVFGRGERGYSGWDRPKQKLDQQIKLTTAWTIHDLRRSTSTHMGEIGILPHVVEACLNHISGSKGGTAGIYNKAQYETWKAEAWARWADHLLAAVEGRGTNVATLRRA
jgi:integrase